MGRESNFIPFPHSVLCHTVITRKLWNSKDDFEKQALTLKKFNNHETQQLCSVSRPISHKKRQFLGRALGLGLAREPSAAAT